MELNLNGSVQKPLRTSLENTCSYTAAAPLALAFEFAAMNCRTYAAALNGTLPAFLQLKIIARKARTTTDVTNPFVPGSNTKSWKSLP